MLACKLPLNFTGFQMKPISTNFMIQVCSIHQTILWYKKIKIIVSLYICGGQEINSERRNWVKIAKYHIFTNFVAI